MKLKEDFFKEISKKEIDIWNEIYTYASTKGRYICRKKYVESGYLIVDPEKKEQLLKECEDPCKYCEFYEPAYKRGCTKSEPCEAKQKQFDALEIKKYFIDNCSILN